jgi:site-specific recombinase XerD
MSFEARAADPPEILAYVDHQRLAGLSPETIERRGGLLRTFADWLDRPLVSATLADLRAFVASRRERVARSTHFSEVSHLKAFYAALVELGLLDESPAERLRCRSVHAPRPPLSLGRVRELLAESGELYQPATPQREALALRDQAVLELLFATGVRNSELRAIQITDVDLTEGSLFVRRAKRGESRRVPLPQPTIEVVRRYLFEGRAELLSPQGDPGHLILTRRGGPLTRTALRCLVRRVARRCGGHTYPHAFRTTIATELTRAGTPLLAVQKLLGHAHLTTTSYYVRVALDDMREAMEQVDSERPRCHKDRTILGNLQSRLFHDWQMTAV